MPGYERTVAGRMGDAGRWKVVTLTWVVTVTLVVTGLLWLTAAGRTASADDHQKDLFYTTSDGGLGLFSIQVSHRKVTVKEIGPTNGGECLSLALSSSGTLYSMCGELFGVQRLATIDRSTGHANPFGEGVSELAVMGMGFAPDGTLYAVGGCIPDKAFECTRGPDYNSLYIVNEETGAFARVGSTGAGQFFMDLAFDRKGRMFGVTSTVNPSSVPATLYRIDPATGAATKIVDLVGSNLVMALSFGRNGGLYATDFAQRPGLYRIDTKTGYETAIAALPFGSSHNLELANPEHDHDDDYRDEGDDQAPLVSRGRRSKP